MASKRAQVTLRGRFAPGTDVELVKVRDESVLRTSPSDKVVGTATTDENGVVEFTDGIVDGHRYFIRGYRSGVLIEARVSGRTDGESFGLPQAPIEPDRVKLADGRWADGGDAAAENGQTQETPELEVQPGVRQDQVPDDVVQRSSTPFGAGTPILDGEEGVTPYHAQEDVEDGVIQRSSTETGMATPLGPWEGLGQQDSPEGLIQRSDTPYGVLTPIPAGDAVDATAAVQAPEAKNQGHEAAALEDVGGEPPVAEGQSALNPIRDPNNEATDGPNATDDQSGVVPNHGLTEDDAPADEPVAEPTPAADLVPEPEPEPTLAKELKGAELKERAAAANIEGRGSMTADELRKAVAKAERSK